MAKKDENTSVIVPMAEVKLGKYTAKFTEANLRDLFDLIEFVKDGMMDSIRQYDDFLIEVFREDNSKAEECMKGLDGLRGYAWWFNRVAEIEVRHEKSEKVRTENEI